MFHVEHRGAATCPRGGRAVRGGRDTRALTIVAPRQNQPAPSPRDPHRHSAGAPQSLHSLQAQAGL